MYGLSVQKVYASGLKGTENLEKDSLRVKSIAIPGRWRAAWEPKDEQFRYDSCGSGPEQPPPGRPAPCTGYQKETPISYRRRSAQAHISPPEVIESPSLDSPSSCCVHLRNVVFTRIDILIFVQRDILVRSLHYYRDLIGNNCSVAVISQRPGPQFSRYRTNALTHLFSTFYILCYGTIRTPCWPRRLISRRKPLLLIFNELAGTRCSLRFSLIL